MPRHQNKVEMSLDVLERLLKQEDGEELRVALCQKVVEAFSKKYIKAILHDQCYQKVLNHFGDELKVMVEVQISEILEKPDAELDGLVGEDVRCKIRNAINKVVQDATVAALKGFLDQHKDWLKLEIRKASEIALKADVARQIKDGVQVRLNAAFAAAANYQD